MTSALNLIVRLPGPVWWLFNYANWPFREFCIAQVLELTISICNDEHYMVADVLSHSTYHDQKYQVLLRLSGMSAHIDEVGIGVMGAPVPRN